MTRALPLALLLASCAHPAASAGSAAPRPVLHRSSIDLAPDGDEDRDGIPNRDDLCPRFPEDKDGFVDDDGCPDFDCDDCCASFRHASIQFFPDRTTIPAVEFPLVVAVARELTSRPELRVIELESWSPLGELRMVAVRDALMKLGIAQSRIRFRTTQHRVPPPVWLHTGVGIDVAEGVCTTVVDPNDES